MRDTPQSQGFLLNKNSSSVDSHSLSGKQTEDFNKAQKAVLKNPAIWILALSSAFMYISPLCGKIVGVFSIWKLKGIFYAGCQFYNINQFYLWNHWHVFSGIISDKMFSGSRNIPALVFGLMNVIALCLFLLVPGVHFWIDVLAMVLFGLGIGVLICFLGGLMAVDIAPP